MRRSHLEIEKAAEYLRTVTDKKDNAIEWSAVRLSGLINEESIAEI